MPNASNTNPEAMNEEARTRLVTSLGGRGAHDGYDSAVRDFPARLFNEKPANVPYTFWHQLEHIRITQRDMLDYIKDPKYTSPQWPSGYWPPQDETTDEKGWNATIDRYHADRKEFVELMEDPTVNLLAPVEHLENRSIFRCALIIIDHTSYHLGEFIMGRQILGAWKSALG